jgi:tetratricopeptide (TPR) repeat protein
MAQAARSGTRRWHAFLIIALFLVAVAGSAAVGWWYARESPPHQGPIIVLSVDPLPAASLPAYGAQRSDTTAIDALSAESVIFDRAYTHSPQVLPAHSSMLSGHLPVDHGVRDDAGFALQGDARTLAELLRNRGFATGAAVSSFLLRRESGLAQGFSFFDAALPESEPADPPVLERTGTATVAAAEDWIRMQSGQRFFLFLQVGHDAADASVSRLIDLLKARDLYESATIVLVGTRGDAGSGMTLDEAALRVPLLVKQPNGTGAGRHVPEVVQHIDLLPTLLDMVRAPIPGQLRGRSLRPILDDDDGAIEPLSVYTESLTARFRFGGGPLYSLTDDQYRYLRAAEEELVALAATPDGDEGGPGAETGRLRTTLDRLLARETPDASVEIVPADEERFALLGYLPSVRLPSEDAVLLKADDQRALVAAHRAAAVLIGQKKYSAGIRALQAIAREQPMLAAIHHQLGVLLSRTGRFDESIEAFGAARVLRPESPLLAQALAEAQMRAGDLDAARDTAAEAVALSEADRSDSRARAAAHQVAARVALARRDSPAAIAHADAVRAADPRVPMPQFVRGRLLFDAGMFEEALAAFRDADAARREGGGMLADLHLYLGESLARLDRPAEAETQYREELLAFPRNTQAYASLAMLYRAVSRDDAVEDVINELVASTPTPEGYAVAARLWTDLGDRTRAEALRSDARTRFRGDPSLALLGRDTRR